MGSLAPSIFDMGNICSIIAKEKKKATPPHTLSELLLSVKLDDDICLEALERELQNNVWLKRFQEYLQNRRLEEEETALKYLVMTQPLKNQFSKRATFGSSESEKRRLFSVVVQQFLSEESECVLALDNSALHNDLLATLASINAGLKVSDESLNEVLAARSDLLVWEEGLEPIYFKFLQQTSTTQAACLLSLL